MLLLLAALTVSANPNVQQVVTQVDPGRITATLKKLESFGTRFVLSPKTDPQHGIGAAQRWIFSEFQSYSTRLQVAYDVEHAKDIAGAKGDTELTNVIAILPGTVEKDRFVVISDHYDSIAFVEKAGTSPDKQLSELKRNGMTDAQAREYQKKFPPEEMQWTRDIDWKATALSKAPGVTDDGSGIAAVLELARVMSRYRYKKSIVFVAFSGEEIGLKGSSGYAEKARKQKMQIEAVLNNDIIGSDVSGDGQPAGNTLRVFSAGPDDSLSRSVARYTKEIAEQYVPDMKVELVLREDRFGRGGDHTSFANAGFGAVRLTTKAENFANQHTVTDTFANTSVPYITQVTRMNGAVLASLALAPAPPVVTWNIPVGPTKRTGIPLITRGKSHYDAVLRWQSAHDPDIASYSILTRPTTSSEWETQVPAAPANSFTFPDRSIDDIVIGVRAIDKDGNPSLVSAFVPEVRFAGNAKPESSSLYLYLAVAACAFMLALSAVLFYKARRLN